MGKGGGEDPAPFSLAMDRDQRTTLPSPLLDTQLAMETLLYDRQVISQPRHISIYFAPKDIAPALGDSEATLRAPFGPMKTHTMWHPGGIYI